MTEKQKRILIVALVIHVIMLSLTWRDLSKRPAAAVRGKKRMWRLASLPEHDRDRSPTGSSAAARCPTARSASAKPRPDHRHRRRHRRDSGPAHLHRLAELRRHGAVALEVRRKADTRDDRCARGSGGEGISRLAASVKIHLVTEASRLRDFVDEWETLADATSSPRSGGGFVTAWAEHMMDPDAELRVWIATEGQRVLGVLPFVAEPMPRGRVRLVTPSTNLMYGTVPIAHPDRAAEVVPALVDEFAREADPVNMATLYWLPRGFAVERRFLGPAGRSGMGHRRGPELRLDRDPHRERGAGLARRAQYRVPAHGASSGPTIRRGRLPARDTRGPGGNRPAAATSSGVLSRHAAEMGTGRGIPVRRFHAPHARHRDEVLPSGPSCPFGRGA